MLNDSPSVDFRTISLIYNLLTEYHSPDPHSIAGYLPWSQNPVARSRAHVIYQDMVTRQGMPVQASYNIQSNEVKVFQSRFKSLSNDNETYALAFKKHPSIEELKRFAVLNPNWSHLFPIKLFLINHPEMAKDYDGLQPFGRRVADYFERLLKSQSSFIFVQGRVDGHIIYDENKLPDPRIISSQPTLADHIDLMNLTNTMAKLSGKTSVWINTAMYIEGDGL